MMPEGYAGVGEKRMLGNHNPNRKGMACSEEQGTLFDSQNAHGMITIGNKSCLVCSLVSK